jgi:hypothetical protein
MSASTVQELDACMSKHGVVASAVPTRLAKCLAALPLQRAPLGIS